MTEAKFVNKVTLQVVESMNFTEDETLETLLYWVKVAIAGDTKVYAEFMYDGSLYLVGVEE